MRRASLVQLLVTFLLAGPACTHWRAETVTPAQGLASERPGRARFHLQGGKTVTLTSPVVRGDSIVGVEGDRGERVVFAVLGTDEVQAWETRRSNPAGTVFLGLGIALAALVALAAMMAGYDGLGS